MDKNTKRARLVIAFIFIIFLFAVVLFPLVTQDLTTFSKLKQNEEATMEKYKNDWASTEIHHQVASNLTYTHGEQVATITIPKMDIYEYPIYYGADPVNNNWQITAPGHLGNWSMFGEPGVTCVGAHNYQLFKDLKNLEPGDQILVETSIDRYVYVVDTTDIFLHERDDWDIVATRHKEAYALNLMTCYPFDEVKTQDMYIVYTTLQKGTVFE